LALPKAEAGSRRSGYCARCKAKPARPRRVQSPHVTARSPHAAGLVSHKGRSTLQRRRRQAPGWPSRRRRGRRQRPRRAGRESLHKPQAGSHVRGSTRIQSPHRGQYTVHAKTRAHAMPCGEKGACYCPCSQERCRTRCAADSARWARRDCTLAAAGGGFLPSRESQRRPNSSATLHIDGTLCIGGPWRRPLARRLPNFKSAVR
jgi:hypothetical protein